MRKSVLTLGTFDGVHRGHQALLRKVVQRARTLRVPSCILAFEMPPRHAGEPLAKPVLLTTLNEKIQLLKRFGIDRVHLLKFDRRTASTLPEDFFRDTILKLDGAREMVVGPKVAFGKNRSGRLPLLRRLGRQYRVRIFVVSNIAGSHGMVSSRRIRALLTRGNLEQANALLGYPYSVAGKVIQGNRRGRRIGFPTANLQIDDGKMLPPGVYWVKVHRASSLPANAKEALRGIDGLCNVGTRPTFEPRSNTLHCEVFLLEGGRDLYERRLRIVFLRKLRPERRFRSAAALRLQITKDLEAVQLYKNAHFSI